MTAAVVGVILNLALTFGIVALFESIGRGRFLTITFPVPEVASLDAFSLALALAGFVALFRFRLNVLWVIGGSALAGFVYQTFA